MIVNYVTLDYLESSIGRLDLVRRAGSPEHGVVVAVVQVAPN